MKAARTAAAVALAVLAVIAIALGTLWAGLDRADKLASVIGVGIGLAGLLLSWLAFRSRLEAEAAPTIKIEGNVSNLYTGRWNWIWDWNVAWPSRRRPHPKSTSDPDPELPTTTSPDQQGASRQS